MLRTYIVLPDGTEIFSGAEGAAVMSCSLTQSVSNQTELAPGAVCAAMAEVTLWEDTPLSVGAGDALTLWQVDESGNRRRLGIFLAEKPERSGNLLKLTAYDRLRLLDKDIGGYIAGLDAWPYSLLELAQLCCRECGLELQNGELPNGDFPVEKGNFQGVTGRMVMEWVAQIAGCFCQADEMGQPVLRWFTPAEMPITAADCFSGGMTLETYETPPIRKVVLRQSETDVGTAWPENTDGCALCITGNPFLAAKNANHLKAVAQTLYERFGGLSYTPGNLRIPSGGWAVGQTVTVTDPAGRGCTFYIMGLQRSNQGDILTCTGSGDREAVEAVENRSARGLAGKMLTLQADVDGLRAENTDNRGKIASLSLGIDRIRSQVSSLEGQETRLTALEQTAQGLTVTVEKLTTQGAQKLKTAMGYTFDDSGLRIRREGQQMENLLDNTGM